VSTDNDIIFSNPMPPVGVLDLDEEMASNGMLPFIHIGEYLEWAIWHLAGQMRALPGLWLGAVDTSGGSATRVADGGTLTQSWMLKPGGRDVLVSILASTDDIEVNEMEIEITLAGGTYSSNKILTKNGPYGIQLIDAWDAHFMFRDVGQYPGMIKNRYKTMSLTISPNGADLLLWGVNLNMDHTVQLEQVAS